MVEISANDLIYSVETHTGYEGSQIYAIQDMPEPMLIGYIEATIGLCKNVTIIKTGLNVVIDAVYKP
jgi:hypothetical protein